MGERTAKEVHVLEKSVKKMELFCFFLRVSDDTISRLSDLVHARHAQLCI